MSRTLGAVSADDILLVTAADGITTKTYHVQILGQKPVVRQGINAVHKATISVYPNPTSGVASITGMQQGCRVQVYNLLGKLVIDKYAARSVETISLEGKPGMYIIVIKNKDGIVGQQKLIVK
jgi:hypothetical protein